MKVYIYVAALYCEECGAKIREKLTAEGKAPEDPDDEGSYDEAAEWDVEPGDHETPSPEHEKDAYLSGAPLDRGLLRVPDDRNSAEDVTHEDDGDEP